MQLHQNPAHPSSAADSAIGRDGLDVGHLEDEPERLQQHHRLQQMLYPGKALQQFAPLPPGHHRTGAVVPFHGRLGPDGHVAWHSRDAKQLRDVLQRASPGDSAELRQSERALASRYHQLLLQHRTAVHGPGLFVGQSNLWPPPPAGMAYNEYSPGHQQPPVHESSDEHAGPYYPQYSHAGPYHPEYYPEPARGPPVVERARAPAPAPEPFRDPLLPSYEGPSAAPRVPTRLPGVHPHMPSQLATFLLAFDCAEPDDDEHAAKRKKLFERFDTNQNGYISLAECGAGVLLTLAGAAGREATQLYHRYYRAYIRAFSDACEAAATRPTRHDDDYVAKSEFRLLLSYLRIYATWYEVFAELLDAGADRRAQRDALLDTEFEALRIEPDHHVVRKQWEQALQQTRAAGASWAPYEKLRTATAEDFDRIDRKHSGYIDFRGLCEWLEAAEVEAGTPAGQDVGANRARKKSARPASAKPPQAGPRAARLHS